MSVSQAERRLTSKDQAKDDLAISLAPHANWMKQIVPAPMAVASLAQLAILSTQHKDFHLNKPKNGFVRVKYPESFKACLMQVCNEGYEAFNLSHVAMDEVRLGTMSIPGDMTKAVKILVNGTDDEVEDLLPSVLESIESVAVMCSERSNSVVSKYESVRELIDELLETGMSTKGHSEAVMEKVLLDRKLEEDKKIWLELKAAEAKKMKEDAERDLEKKTKDYNKAVNSMPGIWSVMGAKMLEGAVSAATMGVTTLASGGFGMVEKVVEIGAHAAQGIATKAMKSINTDQTDGEHKSKKKGASAQTKMVYNLLQQHPETIELAKKDLIINGQFNNDKGPLRGMKYIFESADRSLNDPGVDETLKTRVQPFYEKISKMIEKIETGDPNLVFEVQYDLTQLGEEATILNAEASNATKSFLQKTTPRVAKAQSTGETDHIIASMNNAQFKMQMTNEVLERTRLEYNQKSEELMKTNGDLMKTLAEISKLDATHATLEEILETLAKGLELLAKLKDQWVQIAQFFQEMGNLIKAAADKNKMFVDMAGKGMDKRNKGMSIGDVTRDIIYSYAREAVTIAYVVNKLADGYVKVSKVHLMGPVAKLPQLMVLEKEDTAKIRQQSEAIMKECNDAQKAIENMIKTEKKDFEKALENRMKAVKEEFAPMVKDQTPDEVQKIEKLVKTGIKHSEDDGIDEW